MIIPWRRSGTFDHSYSIVFPRKGHVLFVIKAGQPTYPRDQLAVILSSMDQDDEWQQHPGWDDLARIRHHYPCGPAPIQIDGDVQVQI